MDHAKINKVLRGFWVGYALFMIAGPLIYLFTPYGSASLLIVSALGSIVLWAAWWSPVKKSAAIVLQLFFVLVIIECLGAMILGDVISPMASMAMLLISALSLVHSRRQVKAE